MSTTSSEDDPQWKTMNEIVKRVTELKSIPPPSNEFTPCPAEGRTFMDIPQPIRFNVYERLLSSNDPITRPWPRTKFTVQLLRVSKDVFAEASYCFYGKGDQGRDLDDEIDLLSTNDQARKIYMSGIPHCHTNNFQMMMNHATGEFGHPPEPYLSLINHIALYPSTRLELPAILTHLHSFPNLTHLTIHVHSLTAIFGSSHPKPDACHDEILWEDRNHNGNFIRNVVSWLNDDDDDDNEGNGRLVEVDIEQHVLQPVEPINTNGAPLDDWAELPDEEFATVYWDVQIGSSRSGAVKWGLVHRGNVVHWDLE